MIFFDLETYQITRAKAPRPVCVTTSEHGIVHWRDFARTELVPFLRSEICGHNVLFDLLVIFEHAPWARHHVIDALAEGRVHDTQIRDQYVQNAMVGETRPRSLVQCLDAAGIAHNYTVGADGHKDEYWRTRYGKLTDLPIDEWPDDAKRYALEDVRVLPLLFASQARMNIFEDCARRLRGAFTLNLMSARASLIDRDRVRDQIAHIVDEIHEAEAILKESGAMRADGSKDTARAKEIFGGDALDKKTLTRMKDPIADAYTRVATLKALVKRMRSLDTETSTARYNPLASTGRTTCSGGKLRGTDNRQNWPRTGGARECFIPRPGYVFVDGDWAAAELSALATVNGIGCAMARAINDGIDLHMRVAAAITHLEYEMMMRDKKKYADKRQTGKAANFGIPGGLGVARFVEYARDGYGVVMTEAEAKKIKDAWLKTFPEMEAFFAGARKRSDAKKIVTLKSNRVRAGQGVTFTNACNTMFQGLAADMAIHALWQVAVETLDRRAGSVLYGSFPWAFVHDQIVIESPANRGVECAARLKEIMEDAGREWCYAAPPKAEVDIKERWGK